MKVQEFSAFSLPLEEDWLDSRDAGQLVEALKALITELIGWGADPFDAELPEAS